eukprot:8670488-Pyramimonas_sp.AAC.1
MCTREVQAHVAGARCLPASSRVEHARNLGTDATTGSRRRIGVQRARFIDAGSRSKLLRLLREAGADVAL